MANDKGQRLTVIINPKSGSAGDNFRGQVETALKEAGADFQISETTPERSGADLAQEAIKNGARHLVACGGDGTVMAVVNGIGQSGVVGDSETPQITLSIVPGGTANLLAGALKIPTDLNEAIKTILSGHDFALDLGQCGKTWFALGVGLGLTEKLVSQTSAKEKEILGKLAYARAMLRELGMKPHNFNLKLDDAPERVQIGVAIVIANSGEIGGGLTFAPDAKMDDGLLDVCVLRRFYFRDVVRLIWRSILGTMPADRAVEFYQARRVELKSDPPLDVQIDGEEVEQTMPLSAEVVPHAILVRVPAEKAASGTLQAELRWRTKIMPLVRGALFVLFLVGLIFEFAKRRKN